MQITRRAFVTGLTAAAAVGIPAMGAAGAAESDGPADFEAMPPGQNIPSGARIFWFGVDVTFECFACRLSRPGMPGWADCYIPKNGIGTASPFKESPYVAGGTPYPIEVRRRGEVTMRIVTHYEWRGEPELGGGGWVPVYGDSRRICWDFPRRR